MSQQIPTSTEPEPVYIPPTTTEVFVATVDLEPVPEVVPENNSEGLTPEVVPEKNSEEMTPVENTSLKTPETNSSSMDPQKKTHKKMKPAH